MAYSGTIESQPNPPGVSRSAWLDVIDSRTDLRPSKPQTGINPFTGEPREFLPPPDCAEIVVGETQIGWISWAPNEENTLIVSGELTDVLAHAEEIAFSLGGVFKPLNESES